MTITEQVKPIWKCQVEGCDYTAEPTLAGYRKMSGHQLAHAAVPKEKRGFSLIDEGTGEILAQKLPEATEKGFIVEPPKVEASPPELEPEPEPESQLPAEPELEPEVKPAGKMKEEKKQPEITSEGIFAYTIHLPADAFTLFNLAKFSGDEKDGAKPFDEWIWDCIVARFRHDYKKQLLLAPIEQEEA